MRLIEIYLVLSFFLGVGGRGRSPSKSADPGLGVRVDSKYYALLFMLYKEVKLRTPWGWG